MILSKATTKKQSFLKNLKFSFLPCRNPLLSIEYDKCKYITSDMKFALHNSSSGIIALWEPHPSANNSQCANIQTNTTMQSNVIFLYVFTNDSAHQQPHLLSIHISLL